MLKKQLSIIIIISVISCMPLIASAGDYTSSDPNKNSSFNRDNAKYYAENYGGLFETPYEGTGSGTLNGKFYNFYDNGGDCTNFASQMLKYGGMSQQGTNRDSISSWFYNGTYPNYSCTWTDAHWFRQYWGNVNDVGSNKAYSYKVYTVAQALQNWTTIYNYMYEGDVVQHAYPNGETYHSQEVHAWGSGNLYYSQHSTTSGAFYTWHNLYDYVNGHPSDYYFFTYQIKNGA